MRVSFSLICTMDKLMKLQEKQSDYMSLEEYRFIQLHVVLFCTNKSCNFHFLLSCNIKIYILLADTN